MITVTLHRPPAWIIVRAETQEELTSMLKELDPREGDSA